MSLVTLKTELRQELKLTPQLLQSMEVLQMNAQELLDYLGRIGEENPLLEQEDAALHGAYEELCRKVSWIDAAGGAVRGDAPLPERGAADRETESLTAFLLDQLERRQLEKPLLALSRYLVQLLDEDGRLTPEELEDLESLKLPPGLLDRAMEVLQSLDPAGVGARSLEECLLLQLRRQGPVSPALETLVLRFLPELSRRHYGPITRETGLSPEEIQAAGQRIAALDPHPCRAFAPEEPAVYIRPDVFVAELDGQLQVVLNEYYLPRVSISSYYARLLRESGDPETRDYLREKMQQAKWLLSSLERRGDTLRRCAEALLEAQRPFFAGETGALAPLNLLTLAQTLGLHPSTVSRATRGKYLQCRQGTYPLRYFFTRPVGDQGGSAQGVKRRMLELVRGEDPARPLSDQQLCRLLAAEGMPVARRTVAKYRMELGLGASGVRKRRP